MIARRQESYPQIDVSRSLKKLALVAAGVAVVAAVKTHREQPPTMVEALAATPTQTPIVRMTQSEVDITPVISSNPSISSEVFPSPTPRPNPTSSPTPVFIARPENRQPPPVIIIVPPSEPIIIESERPFPVDAPPSTRRQTSQQPVKPVEEAKPQAPIKPNFAPVSKTVSGQEGGTGGAFAVLNTSPAEKATSGQNRGTGAGNAATNKIDSTRPITSEPKKADPPKVGAGASFGSGSSGGASFGQRSAPAAPPSSPPRPPSISTTGRGR